ncbi:MAG: hypothetical protein JNN28_02140 [Saprospiraceae bacterium]|nr:hypothetical protein [Saprospiraceae bacterium]
MVTVYIWKPTGIADLNLEKTVHYAPSQQPKSSSQLKTFARSVGHASIHIQNDDFDLYFSLYPDNRSKELALLSSPNSPFPSIFSVDYEVDCDEIGGHADLSVRLHNLDETTMCRKLNHFNNVYSEYILFKKNCSSLVLELLKIGSMNFSPDMFKNASDFVKRVGGIAQVFAFFYELQNPSKLNMHGYFFSNFQPLKAAFNLFEICGGVTPEAAYNYARFLKEEIG